MEIHIQWNIDSVRSYIESYGCKLLDTKYINIKTKLHIIGTCGHEYLSSFDDFKYKDKHVCRTCGLGRGGLKRRIQYKDVYDFIKSKGCKLLSNYYIGNSKKLEILFTCGHIGYRSFADFKTCNYVCYDCSGIKKYDKNYIDKKLEIMEYHRIGESCPDVNSKIILEDIYGYKYFASFHHAEVCFKANNHLREFDIYNPYSWENVRLWTKLNNKRFSLLSPEYKGKDEYMEWQCSNPDCEEVFMSKWASILSGQGCPYCSVPAKRVGKKNNLEYKFPEIAKEFNIEANKCLPSEVLCGSNRKTHWVCSACGHKWVCTIGARTCMKSGCPKCNESHGEKMISLFLDNYKINYKRQKKFDDCKHTYKLPFDFYLLDYNILIEYQGQQHFIPVKHFGGEKEFLKRKVNDQIKFDYCKNNNIKLIEIPYLEFDNIELILNKELILQRKEENLIG